MMMAREAAMVANSAQTPITPGELDVRALGDDDDGDSMSRGDAISP